MKNIILKLVVSISLISCSSTNVISDKENCVANEEFRKQFFWNIENIEKKIQISQDESFKKSLNFLSKYVEVSFDKTLNYANLYSLDVFNKDKEKWLIWYQANKCKNIKVITKNK